MAETAKTIDEDDGRICSMGAKREATIDDLYHVEGKAELVNGELVLMPLSSGLHGFACLRIAASLLATSSKRNADTRSATASASSSTFRTGGRSVPTSRFARSLSRTGS